MALHSSNVNAVVPSGPPRSIVRVAGFCSAASIAVSMTRGMRLTLVTPEGYELPRAILERAEGFCRDRGSIVEQQRRITPAEVLGFLRTA